MRRHKHHWWKTRWHNSPYSCSVWDGRRFGHLRVRGCRTNVQELIIGHAVHKVLSVFLIPRKNNPMSESESTEKLFVASFFWSPHVSYSYTCSSHNSTTGFVIYEQKKNFYLFLHLKRDLLAFPCLGFCWQLKLGFCFSFVFYFLISLGNQMKNKWSSWLQNQKICGYFTKFQFSGYCQGYYCSSFWWSMFFVTLVTVTDHCQLTAHEFHQTVTFWADETTNPKYCTLFIDFCISQKL